jgi:hypothetical protein
MHNPFPIPERARKRVAVFFLFISRRYTSNTVSDAKRLCSVAGLMAEAITRILPLLHQQVRRAPLRGRG